MVEVAADLAAAEALDIALFVDREVVLPFDVAFEWALVLDKRIAAAVAEVELILAVADVDWTRNILKS